MVYSRTLTSHAIAACTLAAAIVLPAAAQANCIADWSEAAPIVRREGLATIEHVGRMARDKAAGQIVSSMLCRDQKRYFYRVVVRQTRGGSLKTLVVDAKEPFER